ncbi:glutathione S-transferase omega-1-like [Eleutherodactylus coqui]|uniref:glutathione S-transferase omega-1-like n=1 Tax=Eleutherodactylus coqui TaxID=57060 RepID=UPI00346210C0
MSGSQRSLAKGSPAPGPVPEGLIRLYSMRFCPYALRARLVLVAKEIRHEVININLLSKPEWFLEKSPQGSVPSLETPDGRIIYDSIVVCDYLDEAFPGKKLTPEDPYEKAQQKMLLKCVNKVASILQQIFSANKNNLDTTELKTQFFEEFKKLEEGLAKKNTPYFGGESVSMIDYMIWPFFERLVTFDVLEFLDNTPRMNAWDNLMLQDPAITKTYTEPDILIDFYELYLEDSLEAADYCLDEGLP